MYTKANFKHNNNIIIPENYSGNAFVDRNFEYENNESND